MSNKIRPPRYTITPNQLFEELPNMKESEIRVMLVIVRFTFGFQRQTWTASLKTLMKYSGLSKQGVLNGVDGLIKREWIEQDKEGVSEWSIRFEIVDNSEVVNLVDRGGQPSRPPSKILNIKDNKRTKVRDPLLDHPAIQAYKHHAHLHVPTTWRQEVVNVVGEDSEKWGNAVRDWIGHGWNKQNIKGMLEYYQGENKKNQHKEVLPNAADL